MRHRARRAVRDASTCLAVIVRMALTSAVAVAPSLVGLVQEIRVRPVAAVLPLPDLAGQPWAAPSARPAAAAPVTTGPPPPPEVQAPGAVHIPAIALAAYRNADAMMAQRQPDCGVTWNLLAGIGYVESTHAFGGAADERGNPVSPIYGPTLDGSLPGNEIIVAGSFGGGTTYARALGPMQFLPTTWLLHGADADGDGQSDPHNLFDATLAAARYLCSDGAHLRDQSQLTAAVLRYNHSMAYAANVLGWAQAYATGAAPVNLPPLTAPRPRPRPPSVAVRAVDVPAASTTGSAENPKPDKSVRRNDDGDTGSATPRPGSSVTRKGSTDTNSSTTSGSRHSTGTPKVKVGNGRSGGAR
ncbi:lytic murein transglycosylase [Mycolicibacterium sp. 050232]|uniref:lytic transglycosylase domain-containing protein n=1 Tax=Mycolicibacterium sp. 050232 TaxID=3113982 RepID=UPI002E29567B|nr:lytic murein transglycosylase [Mycolicibacterium sp. 050232]MED5814358.1 lytic murein transglycosylase [Mycolicibacterium sp. 050232]